MKNQSRNPEEWLKFAKEEESIQRRIQQQRNNSHAEPTKQPNLNQYYQQQLFNHDQLIDFHVNIRIQHHNPNQYQHRQQHINQNIIEHTKIQNQLIKVGKKEQKMDSCLICNRKNHPTSKCYYKKENGCFKCGQSNHQNT